MQSISLRLDGTRVDCLGEKPFKSLLLSFTSSISGVSVLNYSLYVMTYLLRYTVRRLCLRVFIDMEKAFDYIDGRISIVEWYLGRIRVGLFDNWWRRLLFFIALLVLMLFWLFALCSAFGFNWWYLFLKRLLLFVCFFLNFTFYLKVLFDFRYLYFMETTCKFRFKANFILFFLTSRGLSWFLAFSR